MKSRQNLWLIVAVILLAIVPLWIVSAPPAATPDEKVEMFGGADDAAKDMIGTINPDYRPWFEPLIEPASEEIASLLFALQAALGAGFIGFYLGLAYGKEKGRSEAEAGRRTPSC